MFSRRTSWQRRPNRLTEELAGLRTAGVDVLDLTESNPTRARLPYPEAIQREVLQALSRPDSLLYEPSPLGLRAAREAVGDYYAAKGADVDPDRILLTTGTSEAYACILKLLCDEGDRVLVPEPSYPLFEYLASLEGVAVDPYPLHYDGHYWIDLDALEQAIGPRSRAVMVVSPNNPTGNYLKAAELSRMQEIAAPRGMAIVVDEVFSDYVRHPAEGMLATVAGRQLSALTFALSGASKVLGLPQIKLGWMVVGGPEALVSEAMARLEIILDTYLAVGTPVQHAAAPLLHRRSELAGPITTRILEGESILKSVLAEAPEIRELSAEGGWYSVLRLPAIRREEEWVMKLLLEDHALVHPGYFFNFPSEPHVVVSLLTPTETLEAGLLRLFHSAS